MQRVHKNPEVLLLPYSFQAAAQTMSNVLPLEGSEYVVLRPVGQAVHRVPLGVETAPEEVLQAQGR